MDQKKVPRFIQLLLVGGLLVILILSVVMIILLVLLLKLSGAPAAAVLPTGESSTLAPTATSNPKQPFSLSMLMAGSFSGKTFRPTWTVTGNFFEEDNNGNLLQVDSLNMSNVKLILSNDTMELIHANVSPYTVSSDGKYVVVKNVTQNIYRHSKEATYTVVEISSGTEISSIPSARRFIWNPTVGKSDYIWLSDKHNIIHVLDPRKPTKQINITNSPDPLQFYGIPDWLYEEEIISEDEAIYWSPDGNSISYLHINDTGVKNIQYSMYLKDKQYPIIKSIPYPKVGTYNPTVELWIAKLDGSPAVLATFPKNVLNLREYYIFTVKWISNDALVVVVTNRAQNKIYFVECAQPIFNCSMLLEYNYNQGNLSEWAEPDTVKIVPTDGNHFVTILPLATDDGTNVYNQIASISTSNSNTVKFLTHDAYDVLQITAYNKGTIYFLKAYPLNGQTLWSVKGSGSPICVSCVSPQDCNSSYVQFSPTQDRYILTCSSPTAIPVSYFVSLQNPYDFVTMENNSGLAKKLDQYEFPTYRFLSVPISNGLSASVKLYLPSNFDPTKKYPVLLYVYGGPNSVAVSKKWRVGTAEYFSATRGYIYVNIDARGSGHKGWKIKSPIYRNSGTVEIEDSILVLKSLIDKFPYMDPNRVGAWGWSYGGYTTAAMVEQQWTLTDGSLIQCAVSVAPVTDFTYYDTAYTERFMGLLEDNREGYKRTNLNTNVTAFKNLKGYLLMHGNADDNVHFQNSAMLVKALLDNNVKNFEFVMYPNEQHSLTQSKYYVYNKLDVFFHKCFAS